MFVNRLKQIKIVISKKYKIKIIVIPLFAVFPGAVGFHANSLFVTRFTVWR